MLLCCCSQQQDPPFTEAPVVNIDLEQIRSRGYLTALVDNNSVSYFIYRGLPMGYEYELLENFAQSIGVRLQIKVISGVHEAIDQLNTGKGDVLAFPLTVTPERKEFLRYTKPHFRTHQVLVQRKPAPGEADTLLRRVEDLRNRAVHVISGTVHEQTLRYLRDSLSVGVQTQYDSLTTESESLIRKVALGQIDYTLADHMLAQVNALYYPNLDIDLQVGPLQEISWAVRLNSPALEGALNSWLAAAKKKAFFRIVFNRYFQSPRNTVMRMKSDYSSLNGSRLSPYDESIKAGARRLGWDWRLLGSLIYQESRFLPAEQSWAGARGLMQLMPATARRFGATNPDNPQQSIKAGVRYLQYLDTYWKRKVPDEEERVKFILASYNAGLSHVVDAYKLTRKYGEDPTNWDQHVKLYLIRKSQRNYYRDPVVAAGYCKCEETVNYVGEVLYRYEQYRIHLSADESVPK